MFMKVDFFLNFKSFRLVSDQGLKCSYQRTISLLSDLSCSCPIIFYTFITKPSLKTLSNLMVAAKFRECSKVVGEVYTWGNEFPPA